MPIGLINSPTIFMCLMNSILSKYLDKVIFIFIDDILVYSKNKQEHEEHLRIVLQLLREQQLFAKFIKYDLFKDKIQYLGPLVSKKQISVNHDKIKAITKWHVPKNVTDIRYFMGIYGYYHKFIEGFSKVAYPITSLQNKGKKLDWNEKYE